VYKSEVKGKCGIVARVVADSVSEGGTRITTFELEYPRFIHSELMTHRMLSRNAMSSRAVPISKMIDQVMKKPATPIHWGKNKPGMQANEELTGSSLSYAKANWNHAAVCAAGIARTLLAGGAHKQIVNRILEPFQMMKTVVTATEWNNYFYLRDHEDAQPEIAELAKCMKSAMDKSEPMLLHDGEWHMPYINTDRDSDGEIRYTTEDVDFGSDPENALKASASCCAQVSYRVLDFDLDKALDIYDRLVNSKPVHASPFEHQAKPIDSSEEGVTHVDVNYDMWSGNFKYWVQYRQLIKDNYVSG